MIKATTGPTVIAFVKERFHNAVEIDILGILEGYSSLQIWPPQKSFQGRNYSGRWRNFYRALALFLTGVEFHVLPCVLVCFLVEFDLLFAFSVLSLDRASLFIYVHEHDRLCFPMSTEKTAVFLYFWVRVVLKRTVVGDWRFDNLSGSHLQSQVNSICQSMML